MPTHTEYEGSRSTRRRQSRTPCCVEKQHCVAAAEPWTTSLGTAPCSASGHGSCRQPHHTNQAPAAQRVKPPPAETRRACASQMNPMRPTASGLCLAQRFAHDPCDAVAETAHCNEICPSPLSPNHRSSRRSSGPGGQSPPRAFQDGHLTAHLGAR